MERISASEYVRIMGIGKAAVKSRKDKLQWKKQRKGSGDFKEIMEKEMSKEDGEPEKAYQRAEGAHEEAQIKLEELACAASWRGQYQSGCGK